jgi:cytochrome c oxidase subunit IV
LDLPLPFDVLDSLVQQSVLFASFIASPNPTLALGINMADDHSSHATPSGSAARENFAHPAPLSILFAVFGALVLLTIVTVVVSSVGELGRAEIWVSMGIASVKALLVILFFMHVIHDKGFNKLLFFSSFLFVSLFVGFTLMDTAAYQSDIKAAVNEELTRTVGTDE